MLNTFLARLFSQANSGNNNSEPLSLPQERTRHINATRAPDQRIAESRPPLSTPVSNTGLLPRRLSYEITEARDDALISAAGAGQKETLMVIIDQLERLPAQSVLDTALIQALHSGNAQTADVLVQIGAKTHYQELLKAVDSNNGCLVQAIAPLKLGTAHQRTALLFKAMHRIDEQVYPVSLFDFSLPPSHSQRTRNAEDIAVALIKQGVHLETRDFYGRSLLGLAAGKGNHLVVDAMLNAGTQDINHQDRQGNTPLLLALVPKGKGNRHFNPDNRRALVYALLKHGADPLHKNRLGQTALTLAAQKPMPMTTALLLQALQPPIYSEYLESPDSDRW